jgi:hypothetical protein
MNQNDTTPGGKHDLDTQAVTRIERKLNMHQQPVGCGATGQLAGANTVRAYNRSMESFHGQGGGVPVAGGSVNLDARSCCAYFNWPWR